MLWLWECEMLESLWLIEFHYVTSPVTKQYNINLNSEVLKHLRKKKREKSIFTLKTIWRKRLYGALYYLYLDSKYEVCTKEAYFTWLRPFDGSQTKPDTRNKAHFDILHNLNTGSKKIKLMICVLFKWSLMTKEDR